MAELVKDLVLVSSFDEQNIFCLYKERFLAFLLVVSD